MKIKQNKLRYLLNEEDKTAGVIGNFNASGNIIVPRSIQYESQIYDVTSILECSFAYSQKIKSIQFPKNSKIEKIEKNAFIHSTLQNITIPSSLINLEEGWSFLATNLTDIKIEEDNPRYLFYENKFIIGKSSPEKDYYDVLVFCTRMDEVKVPSFIETIGPYAFSESGIKHIEFSDDSRLQTIEKAAFIYTGLLSINLPLHLTKICEETFKSCRELKNINISDDSNLEIIEKNAFYDTIIRSINIPKSVTLLEKGWCNSTRKLNSIVISQDNQRYKLYENQFIIEKSSPEKENFDVLSFCVRNIKNVKIPNFIEVIGPFAFDNCNKIQRIEFPNDSKLQKIDTYAFLSSSIDTISIPDSLTIIEKGSFKNCRKLRQIKIQNNSKIQTIEKKAFQNSSLENLTIPSSLVELKDEWCNETVELAKIKISPSNKRYSFFNSQFIIGKSNLENENYDLLVFCCRDVKTVFIPKFIKRICPCAFNVCIHIKKFEFSMDSEIQSIAKKSFAFSSIKTIFIPHQITEICKKTFYFCDKLKCVEFPQNSKLKCINKMAFCYSAIERISIPFNVTKIGELAFSACKNLYDVQIPMISKLQIIETGAFLSAGITSISLPPSIKSIGDNSFDCEQLQIVEILSNLGPKIINEGAFPGNSKIKIFIPYNEGTNVIE